MGTDEQDPTSAIADISAALDHLEQGLLTLIRAGAHAATPLEEVTEGLPPVLPGPPGRYRRLPGAPGGRAAPLPDTRRQYRRLQEVLERRDVEFDTTTRVEHVRRRVLWLYRKSRLEHLFCVNLAFERTIRDSLYKQILEMYEELSSLEEAERKLRRLGDDELAAELLEADEPRLNS